MSITYAINGRPVSPADYAQVTSRLLADALAFKDNVLRWHEQVGKTPEDDLDPFRMWLQLDDLIRHPWLAEQIIHAAKGGDETVVIGEEA